jgi:hypothetical protein
MTIGRLTQALVVILAIIFVALGQGSTGATLGPNGGALFESICSRPLQEKSGGVRIVPSNKAVGHNFIGEMIDERNPSIHPEKCVTVLDSCNFGIGQFKAIGCAVNQPKRDLIIKVLSGGDDFGIARRQRWFFGDDPIYTKLVHTHYWQSYVTDADEGPQESVWRAVDPVALLNPSDFIEVPHKLKAGKDQSRRLRSDSCVALAQAAISHAFGDAPEPSGGPPECNRRYAENQSKKCGDRLSIFNKKFAYAALGPTQIAKDQGKTFFRLAVSGIVIWLAYTFLEYLGRKCYPTKSNSRGNAERGDQP